MGVVPEEDTLFDERRDACQPEADAGEDGDGGEECGHVDIVVGDDDDASETAVSGEPFPDHRADYGERDGDPKRREEVRQGARHPQLEEDLHIAGVEEAKEVQSGGVYRPKADEGIYHHGEEGDEGGNHHLGERTETKPNHKKWRNRDDGRDLDEQSDRVDGPLEQTRVGHDSCRHYSHYAAHGETTKGLHKGDESVEQEIAEVVEEACANGAGGRHEIVRNAAEAYRHLPCDSQCQEGDKRQSGAAREPDDCRDDKNGMALIRRSFESCGIIRQSTHPLVIVQSL